jgi:hypothetical protein
VADAEAGDDAGEYVCAKAGAAINSTAHPASLQKAGRWRLEVSVAGIETV